MARQKNDGRGRLGGRAKGTPNKVGATLKTWMEKFLLLNVDVIENEFNAMSARDKVGAFLKMADYIITKPREEISMINDTSITIEFIDSGISPKTDESQVEIERDKRYLRKT